MSLSVLGVCTFFKQNARDTGNAGLGYLMQPSRRERYECGKIGRQVIEKPLTPGMAPPGTDFIIVYIPSPPELDESANFVNKQLS